MAEPRRYQLRDDRANRLIGELLDAVAPGATRRPYLQQLLTTALKFHEDGASVADLKIASAAAKELRYGIKVFAAWRGTRKATVFGSARTRPDAPAAAAAREFGRRMVKEGWMVVTGAGHGIMGAAQEGAGAERSFGLNIRLPFEQEANPWIASDPKLMTFKYFFTRKLFLLREASAVVLFPGGFGTMDESFELLTLMQTGKSAIVPMVLVECGTAPYWRRWDAWLRGTLVEGGLVEPADARLYRIVDTAEEAVHEVLAFYRVFHSSRIVGPRLIFRLRHPLATAQMEGLQRRFHSILDGPIEQAPGPLPGEWDEHPDLPRLILPFNRSSYAALRLLIDRINAT